MKDCIKKRNYKKQLDEIFFLVSRLIEKNSYPSIDEDSHQCILRDLKQVKKGLRLIECLIHVGKRGAK